MRINRPCASLPPSSADSAPSDTPSHFPFRQSEREKEKDSCGFEARSLANVAIEWQHLRSINNAAVISLPHFSVASNFQSPSLSLSRRSLAASCWSGRGKLFFHCAVFWGRSATAAAAAAATNIRATSNRPHDQTPQTQRVAFLRYTSAQAAAELIPDRESNTLPCI